MIKINIGSKIFISFFLILILFGSSTAFFFYNLNEIKFLTARNVPYNIQSLHLHAFSQRLSTFEKAADHYFLIWDYENQEKAVESLDDMLAVIDDFERIDEGELSENVIVLRGLVQDLNENFNEVLLLDLNEDEDKQALNKKILFIYSTIRQISDEQEKIISLNSDLVRRNVLNQEEIIDTSIKQSISMMFVIFISAIMISFFTGRSITKPIYALQKGVEEIEQGNLDVNVGMDRTDEIGHLSRSFDKMVLALKKTNSELEEYGRTLEEKVEERTLELNEKNQALEQFNKFAIGRENKMIELKIKIKKLEEKINGKNQEKI